MRISDWSSDVCSSDLFLLFDAGHLADVEAHVGDLEHVVTAHRIPGVHEAVVAEGDVDALQQQFLDARHAAPLGVGIVAALRSVESRVGQECVSQCGSWWSPYYLK